jgi:G3E family GTPase
MNKIPVHVISGFLGAGKTTAIIQLLKQKRADEQWAIVVNEFGRIAIDGQTLRSSSQKAEVFDITGGCICCSAKVYLGENLDAIIGSGVYNRIIIEPSGLGGIDMVAEIVGSKPVLELKPVICMVDLLTAGIRKIQMIPVYRQQIIKSDIIVFTKTDLITDEKEFDELVRNFNVHFPDAYVYTQSALIDSELLNEIPEKKALQSKQRIFHFNKGNDTDKAIQADNYFKKSCIFDAVVQFDAQKLKKWLQQHPEILRAKGYFRDKDGWKLLNYTLTHCHFEICESRLKSELVIIAEKSETFDYEAALFQISN